ncbi:MAG: YtxH domain-containing protein [Sulfobacillus benefaciens]|uniref:YtxH domain-containing protein n=1 Tax=Sulfobacillus benefaciens TaxID=453960 RepID=A0A2T2XCJ7_9FIRM|nr:MAG: YtxH domain-containing protein [Sulfobacillus benefaciens]
MSDRNWDRLTGLLLGASLGLVAGLLLAPSTGSDTRETLKKKTQDSLGQFQTSVRDIRDSLTRRGQDVLKRGVTEIPLDDEGTPGPTDEGQGA